jgi:hypothetical protein
MMGRRYVVFVLALVLGSALPIEVRFRDRRYDRDAHELFVQGAGRRHGLPIE